MSISTRLLRYFISSTLVPFLCIILISGGIANHNYQQDILTVTDGYLDSLSANMSAYLKDMQQIALEPYFNTEAFGLVTRLSKQDSISYADRMQLETTLDTLLSSLRYIRNDFYSAIIVSGRNVLYSNSNYIGQEVIPDYDWTKEEWYRDAIDLKGKMLFVPPHIPRYYQESSGKKVVSLVSTIRNLATREAYAVIKIDILPESFEAIMGSANFHVPSCLFITDMSDNVICQWTATEEMLSYLEMDGDVVRSVNEKRAFHLSRSVAKSDYTLHVLLDRHAIWMKSARIYLVGLLWYLVAFFVSMYLNHRFSLRISQPIEEMRRVLLAVQKGDFSVRFQSRPHWELQKVGESINCMIEELDRTIQTTYIAELARKDAENRALLSQIQPHFLFNTLDSLIALLYEKDMPKMEKSLYSLSDMLRYALRNGQTVTLKEEFAFVEDYLLLQQNRFSDRLEYGVQVGDGTEETIIPRLLLQPFVENAVIHGMEPLSRQTHLNVQSRKEGNLIHIIVSDDGAGFDSTKTDITKHVGISNCISRLSLFCPDSSVSIQSEVGKGCIIHITFGEEARHADSDC